MKDNSDIYIVRVFIDKNGKFGNPVGIVVDKDHKITDQERQKIATNLGFSESVFINNLNTGNINIFNPIQEVKFAGHAIIGTVWFINTILKIPLKQIECHNEKITVWKENEITWISAKLSTMPPWNLEQLTSSVEVENISKNEALAKKHTVIWAVEDKNKRIIRARTFAPDWGIPEDEANGSGSMLLSGLLKQNITVLHGKGSLIYAKSHDDEFAEVGGRCVLNE